MEEAPNIYDLVLRGGLLIDPGQQIHEQQDLGLLQGKVAAISPRIEPAHARAVLDITGMLITPGLVDLHTHYYDGVGLNSVNPRQNALPSGVTTAVDAGSSGWATYRGLRDHVAPASGIRLLALLHIGAVGLALNGVLPGELHDIRTIDVDRTAERIIRNPEFLVGVKVRMHFDAVQHWEARHVLSQAREAADRSQSRLMVHCSFTPIPLPEILDKLGPGDILTHAFNGNPENMLDRNLKIRDEVLEAAKRGVVFDVGHAGIHFDIDVFHRAFNAGLLPNTISTDAHRPPPGRTIYSLHELVGKFIALGLSIDQAIAAVTIEPAKVLGLTHQIGSLRVGMPADIAVFEPQEGEFTWQDMAGNTVTGNLRLNPIATLREGVIAWQGKKLSAS